MTWHDPQAVAALQRLGQSTDTNMSTDEVEPTLGAIPDYPDDALPEVARALIREGAKSGLPKALVGGSALAAVAAAVGAKAQIEVAPTWHERAILWVVPLGPRGCGKSPAQDLALHPLRDHDAQLGEDDDAQAVRLGDQTLEALVRNLAGRDGAGLLDLDELVILLKGLGEYKRGGGGDMGRFLSLWSGAPWTFDRVGGGAKENKVKLRIARPTLVIVGGLQTARHEALGGEADGLRPRWLPHLVAMPNGESSISTGQHPHEWQMLLGKHLLPARDQDRMWRFDESGRLAFDYYRNTWRKQMHSGYETESTSAALAKAPGHLARIALVLAEMKHPAQGGVIDGELVTQAATIVEFVLNCWRALPEQGMLALSRRDYYLGNAVERMRVWIEEHGGMATRRDLQRAHVAGCRTAADLDDLIGRYKETYPGTIAEVQQEHGRALPTMVVRAPSRAAVRVTGRPPVLLVSPVATLEVHPAANPHNQAISVSVASGDTKRGDTKSGDTKNATFSAETSPSEDDQEMAPCSRHPGLHEVTRRAGLVYLACGCHAGSTPTTKEE